MGKKYKKTLGIAGEAKNHYIPIIQAQHAHQWPTHSYLFQQPLLQIPLQPLGSSSLSRPDFYVCHGDPVDFLIDWKERVRTRIPFICVANDTRPGGDWEIGSAGTYEERLCRRSSLSATLATPGPGSQVERNYPIPSEGGIYSEFVVVFRGPQPYYAPLKQWHDIPVISMEAVKFPRLDRTSLTYTFPMELNMVKNKIRAALRICAYYGHRSVVIGDFGLGRGFRNPPQQLAELWREMFLYDPDVRGRFDHVAFVFEDVSQNTTKHILEDLAKKDRYSSQWSNSKGKGKSKESASSGSQSTGDVASPTDIEIFQHVFSANEIHRITTRPDPRYDISMLTT
ncbi:hypothetical protein F5Y07DRAFT_336092 [Xylaria sp. FL0933]|nr:hypothetical protein F5Y07DRAFT_336092 [Xylaria sp. FL0933]